MKFIIQLAIVFFLLISVTRAETLKNPKLTSPAQPKVCQDCVQHDVSTQSNCNEVTREADSDSRWIAGLNINADQTILGGRVVAYKIRWQRGNWSQWFVPGINDIDWKFNVKNNTQRRTWAYFYSHEHRYILCK